MRKKLPPVSPRAEATITVIPSFHDADPMAVVWHGNYLEYFEEAREALFRSIDYSYQAMIDSGYVWPVVHVEVDYRHPMLVDTPALVTATVVEIENRLVLEYRVTDPESGKLLARGQTIQIAVDKETKQGCLSSPRVLFEKLGVQYPW